MLDLPRSISKPRILVSLLLLVALFQIFAPNTVGQSFTTITTLQMATTSTIENLTGNSCYLYDEFPISAKQGQQITTAIVSSSPIDFYVLTDADWNVFNGNPKCDFSTMGNPLVKQQGITHYDLSVTIPSDGTYHYVFINKSPNTSATVTFGYPSLVTVSLAVTSSGLPGLGDYGTIAMVAVVAVVALALGYFVGTRRGRTAGGAPQGAIKPPSAREQAAGRFCLNCGAGLPPTAKFCNSCGTAQQ